MRLLTSIVVFVVLIPVVIVVGAFSPLLERRAVDAGILKRGQGR